MTLPRALVTAAQGSYGALTPEIRQMAAQVEWGIDFGDALSRFATRCKTPLIDRTVSLVVEAQRAGGSVVDILTAASEDAREIKQIVGERSVQMSMYNVVIYISFFVFIVVVLVLSAQFIPAFKKAVGAASGQQVGGLQFHDFNPEEFNSIFFQAAVVQAIGGGLVGGVLTKGNPVSGFIHIAVMLAVAWLSFRVLVGFL
jgi:flagellar protein FlaJ